MEKQRYSLRTNIGFFLNKPIGFSRDFHAEFPEIFIDPDLNVFNLDCDYRFSRTREGLLLQAKIRGEIDAQCVRCLSNTLKTVTTSFEELFVFAERQEEGSDEVIPEDGYIDLSGVIRDYFLLDLPMNYICKPDCKGVCVECGMNLNLGQCEHTDQRIEFSNP